MFLAHSANSPRSLLALCIQSPSTHSTYNLRSWTILFLPPLAQRSAQREGVPSVLSMLTQSSVSKATISHLHYGIRKRCVSVVGRKVTFALPSECSSVLVMQLDLHSQGMVVVCAQNSCSSTLNTIWCVYSSVEGLYCVGITFLSFFSYTRTHTHTHTHTHVHTHTRTHTHTHTHAHAHTRRQNLSSI